VSELVNTAQLLEEYAKRIGAFPLSLVLGFRVQGAGFRDTAQLLEEYAKRIGALLMCFLSLSLALSLSLSPLLYHVSFLPLSFCFSFS